MKNITPNDWDLALKRMSQIQNENAELQRKSATDKETIAFLNERILNLEGQIEAFKFCITKGAAV